MQNKCVRSQNPTCSAASREAAAAGQFSKWIVFPGIWIAFDVGIWYAINQTSKRNGVIAVGLFESDIPVPVFTADDGAVPVQLHDQREK